ncbi:maleate isomerase [Rubricella aquisinus]|uniref:Maleate isomerase n=1 Tax=Rubricella aquisinus TaxID=2028108 RepID=A0A840X2W6_9RHOB|nr:aspartate/glutamate racemase family protein [Rubricella aquisinus]MBB5516186.1 maleate isomerase [Rubricella aquisinus]
MSHHPYKLTERHSATLGLIVLQVDETIEQDFRRMVPDEVALYVTRIPSGAELTPDTIAQMAVDLPAAARLLPPAVRFDAIGYACTSGTTLIGVERVASLVTATAQTRHVANPLTASINALRAVTARRIAIVSPYIASVAEPIRDAFTSAGFEVRHTVSFGEEVEAHVARIDPASIMEAAHAACAGGEVDAVFLSCTNLRTLDIIAPLEAALGIPVISSNLALAWDMARLAGTDLIAPGRLVRGV